MSKVQILADGEGRKLLMLVLAMGGVAHVRRKQLRQRWLEGSEKEEELHYADHPFFGYLWENFVIVSGAFVPYFILGSPKRENKLRLLAHFVVLGALLVEPQLMSQKFACEFIWNHVPYFSQQKPPEDVWTMFKDWLRCNLPSSTVNAAFQTFVLTNAPDDMYKKIQNPTPLRLGPLFAKFFAARLIVDVSFGVLHRAMHEVKWIYDRVHKRHHEHNTPRTQTNFHFEALDLFLEAIAPLYIVEGVFLATGVSMSFFEQSLIYSALLYYEQASHSGKEAPIVTWFPPLSPLIQTLTGCDTDLILYHTSHHRLYNCNYSISPWPDKLTGTFKMTERAAWNTRRKDLGFPEANPKEV